MTLDSSVTVHFRTVHHRWGWLRFSMCMTDEICIYVLVTMIVCGGLASSCFYLVLFLFLFGKGRTTDDDSVPCRV